MIQRCFIFFCFLYYVDACNEDVCAGIVSKCLLTESCKCDLQNCSTCCKDCVNCLGHLYAECCSCVDMCPELIQANYLNTESHVGDFRDSISTLFQALVSEQDTQERWSTLTFPIIDRNINALKANFKKELSVIAHTNEQEVDPIKSDDIVTVNCSLAYMKHCMSWNKCKVSCQSMGAHSYRWFHNGCCECVGDKCHAYGLGEIRCSQCPSSETLQPVKVQQDINGNQLDFGEDDGNS